MTMTTPCRGCGTPIDMSGGFCSTLNIHNKGYRCFKCQGEPQRIPMMFFKPTYHEVEGKLHPDLEEIKVIVEEIARRLEELRKDR